MWFHNEHPVSNQRTTSSSKETDLTHSIYCTTAKSSQLTGLHDSPHTEFRQTTSHKELWG